MKVATQIPSLAKTSNNTYANYSYVSIDDYYEAVKSTAIKADLFWRCREISSGLDGGNARYTYAFDVYLGDGSEYSDYDQVTVYQGQLNAQAAGAMRSYAEKVFMRSTFKIATGEPDSDAFEPKPVRGPVRGNVSAPPKDAAVDDVLGTSTPDDISLCDEDGNVVETVSDHAKASGIISEFFNIWIKDCKDPDDLVRFWNENQSSVQYLKKHDKDAYQAVVDRFKEAKAEMGDTK